MLADVLNGERSCPAVIIDLGCGDGSALAVAAEHNPAHRFAGIDWSAAVQGFAEVADEAIKRGRSRHGGSRPGAG